MLTFVGIYFILTQNDVQARHALVLVLVLVLHALVLILVLVLVLDANVCRDIFHPHAK